ncbi:MAG: phage holin family protein [Acidobacteria bacterium]|nr:phage holin family protein [Acidobacteriota bacterium]MCB9378970.1 phage holin family protein [Holophagales bacterium]
MSGDRGSWVAAVREVGRAAGGVVRAEISALAGDLGASGRALVTALLIAAVGGAFAFWALGLFVDFAIELLALRLPRWGAVGVALAAFLLVGGALLGWAWARFRRIEPPARTVQRRMAESQRWWSERIVPGEAEREGEGES